MNRSQFIGYIQKPEVLSAESVFVLGNLLKEYPFFQTAQLLYAKNLFNENSIQYANQLKMAAAYSADRKVLYDLISPKLKVVKEENGKLEDRNQESGVVENTQKKFISESSIVEEPVVDEISQDKLIKNFEQKVEKLLDEKLEKLSVKLEESTKAIEQRLTDVEQQAEVQQTEASEPLVSEIKPPKDIQLVYSIEKEFGINRGEQIDAGSIDDMSKDVINEAIDASVEVEMARKMFEEKQKRQDKKEQPVKAEVGQSVNEEQGLDKNAVQPFSKWLKNTKRIGQDREVGRRQIFELIDKFIQEDPRISKPKTEFFSPEAKARKSLEMDENIITETLAKIFVKQKNYYKAIRAYETLSLKYPEKNAFFAAQILEIRKLINQHK